MLDNNPTKTSNTIQIEAHIAPVMNASAIVGLDSHSCR